MQEVRQNVLPKWDQHVYIPKVHLDLCTKHLLVMEFLPGVKLVDGIRSHYKEVAKSVGKSFEEIEEEQKKAILSGTIKFRTMEQVKWSNFFIRLWLFIKDAILSYNPARFMHNISPLRLLNGPLPYVWSERPLDLAEILDILSRVHASEIFADGVFNSDCHPVKMSQFTVVILKILQGNVLLLKDGRLGLIDYGQVKRLDLADRLKYAKLILALARDDRAEIVRLYFDELGTKTKYRKADTAYRAACFWSDRDTPDVLGTHNLATFIDALEAEDPMIQLPEAYIMASRVSIMLRGMGNAFGLKLRVSKLWEDEARRLLISQGVTL